MNTTVLISDQIRAELDVDKLSQFLNETFPDAKGDLAIQRTAGGFSNPTYFLSIGTWSLVLRKQPASILVKSAHAIDREYRVMNALADSAVPVPKQFVFYPHKDILDTPFYLMERIQGRVYEEYALPSFNATDRREAYQSMCEVMANMHCFNWQAAGLSDYGREGNFFARQFKGWSAQWQKFDDSDNPFLDEMVDWLTDKVPSSEMTTICHGDFRMANIMFDPRQANVVGVLDWELSTLGHPLADVAFNTQAWHMAPEENGGLLGLNLSALGIPEEAEYLDWYYQKTGFTEPLTVFHRVFAMFRAAVGCEGIAARGRAGNAFTSDAAQTGIKLAKAYARRGVDMLMKEA